MNQALKRLSRSTLLVFLLSFCSQVFSQSPQKLNSTAPFKMISFTVVMDNNNNVVLKWTKVPEVVIPSFFIERSEDGKKYKNAGLVFTDEKNSNSSFQFKDEKVTSETRMVFYRLRYTDEVGRVFYSDIKMIRLETDKEALQLTTFPNPVQYDLRLTLPKDLQGENINIEVISAGGRILKNFQIQNAGQTESISTMDISKGIYFIKVVSKNKLSQASIIKS